MKHFFSFVFALLIIAIGGFSWWMIQPAIGFLTFSSQEEGFEILAPVEESPQNAFLKMIQEWKRPQGPVRIALQAGHWKNQEVPEELENLKRNGGASGAGKTEAQVVLHIAELTAVILREQGVEVDILPTTVSPEYYADAFISLHADGSASSSVSGFKIAHPRIDYSEKSGILEQLLYDEYEKATNMIRDGNITSGMRGYYAFNWRKYEHAIHPMTPAVILETGFLTSYKDQRILIQKPELAAKGIAYGIISFLQAMNMIPVENMSKLP